MRLQQTVGNRAVAERLRRQPRIASTRSTLQRFFDGHPTSKAVEKTAAAHPGLTTRQLGLLLWAARSKQAFGSLDDYLKTPSLVDERLDLARARSLLPQVPAESIMLDDQPVRGTLDLVDDSDEELDEFQSGLRSARYTSVQMERLFALLRKRNAPHDRRRRELLQEAANARDWSADLDEDEEDEDLVSYALAIPDLDEREESGTDTDGSDSEDDSRYAADRVRRERAQERAPKLHSVLKTQGVKKRLLGVQSDQRKVREDTMVGKSKGAQKLLGQERWERKEPKLSYPTTTVGDRIGIPDRPTKRQLRDLATINALLAYGVPPELAAQLVASTFFVAQYRGLFYARSTFTHQTRAQHRNLDETDQPVFSSTAVAEGRYGMAGYYYLYNTPLRHPALAIYKEHIELEAQRVAQVLQGMRREPVSEKMRQGAPRATKRWRPQNALDVHTQLYSQDYDEYGRRRAERSDPEREGEDRLDPIFDQLPNAELPVISTGDTPTHAAKYAYGIKAYKGHEDNVLEPEYDDDGKPRHPYSGKLYTMVHPLSDYDEASGPTHHVSLQNAGRLNLGQNIIPEREAEFLGMIERDRLAAQMKAKFPDFSRPWKPVDLDKYGLTQELHAAFSSAFRETRPGTKERDFVEALLSHYLSQHSELKAIESAVQKAGELGGRLVYRTGLRSFGFEPPLIEQERAKPIVNPAPLLARLTIKQVLELIVTKGDAFRVADDAEHAPDVQELVRSRYGRITRIDGSDLACYVRSIVTAGVRHGFIDPLEIETHVSAITDHLASVRLRTRRHMINAGGLVAAEARRVLHQLTGFDPQVTVVMWDEGQRSLTEFHANDGQHPVRLFFSNEHFELLG